MIGVNIVVSNTQYIPEAGNYKKVKLRKFLILEGNVQTCQRDGQPVKRKLGDQRVYCAKNKL